MTIPGTTGFQQVLSQIGLSLPELSTPQYKSGQYGEWRLQLVPPELRGDLCVQHGYVSTIVIEPQFHILHKNGEIWMNNGRLEVESHLIHVKHATGCVLVGGLGMGFYVYNIAHKPDVTHVIVVEQDQSIIDMIRQGTDFPQWPCIDKITFVKGDVKKITKEWIASNNFPPVDYLYMDIWPTLGSYEALPDTKLVQGNVGAKIVSWWGQELDFAEWMVDKWRSDEMVLDGQLLVPRKKGVSRLEDWDQFQHECGLVIPERSKGYLEFCWIAAVNQAKQHQMGKLKIKDGYLIVPGLGAVELP